MKINKQNSAVTGYIVGCNSSVGTDWCCCDVFNDDDCPVLTALVFSTSASFLRYAKASGNLSSGRVVIRSGISRAGTLPDKCETGDISRFTSAILVILTEHSLPIEEDTHSFSPLMFFAELESHILLFTLHFVSFLISRSRPFDLTVSPIFKWPNFGFNGFFVEPRERRPSGSSADPTTVGPAPKEL
uniref:Uncharacterized protein n=1 Tax=Glossina austeni TaxID=7395 RepID=A0A1A9UPC0_GLOAU